MDLLNRTSDTEHRTPIESRRGKRWALPVVTALVAGLMAFTVTSLLPKSYRSEATLYFPNAGDSAGGLLGSLRSLAGTGGAVSERGGQAPLLWGLLNSPQVASGPQTAIAVLASLRARGWVCDKLDLPRRWDMKRSAALKRLDGAVSFGINKHGLLALEAVDRDPRLTADILNAYIRRLSDLAEKLSLNVATRNRRLIESRLTKARARLADAERRLREMTERDPNAVISVAADQAARGLVDLQSERARAQAELDAVTAELQVEVETARSVVHEAYALPALSPVAREARTRVRRLETDLAVARVQYGPDHPQYRLLAEQLKAARDALSAEIGREKSTVEQGLSPQIAALRARQAGLEAQRDGLDRAIAEVERLLTDVPQRQLARVRLQREAGYIGDLVGTLEMQLELARIAEEREGTTFEVVDQPEVPEEPFAPRRLFSTALAMVAGLLLGVAWQVGQAIRRNA